MTNHETIGEEYPKCGHSACSQHFIDTGLADCIQEDDGGEDDDSTELYRGKANLDEECEMCAYPFDAGDEVWRDENENPFCSRKCVDLYQAWLGRLRIIWGTKVEVTP